MKITGIAWIIIVTFVSAISMIAIKKYVLSASNDKLLYRNNFANFSIKESHFYIVATIVLYLVLFIGYAEILSKYPMVWIYLIWFASMVFILFSGALIFGEKLKPINIVGIVLGLVAIFLLIK